MKLSHSAKEKFKQCGKMYDYHYNKKIRPTWTDSPLFFGGAIDEALNILLLKKKKNLTDDEKELLSKDIVELYTKEFTNIDINGERVNTKLDLRASFSHSDYKPNCLTESQLDELESYARSYDFEFDCILTFVDDIISSIKEDGRSEVELDALRVYHRACWLSVYSKGLEMIKAFERDIYPLLEEVHSIQYEVDIEGMIRGFVDYEATIGGKRYTMDNKTSSRKYKESDIKEKGQLPLYDFELRNGNCGYSVMMKNPKEIYVKDCVGCHLEVENVRKRKCPECGGALEKRLVELKYETQLILGEVNEEDYDIVLTDFEKVLDKIDNNEYSKTGKKDGCFFFGRRCMYYDICQSGVNFDDQKALVKK